MIKPQNVTCVCQPAIPIANGNRNSRILRRLWFSYSSVSSNHPVSNDDKDGQHRIPSGPLHYPVTCTNLTHLNAWEKKRKRDEKREKEGDLISMPGNHQKYRRDRNISCCFGLYDDISYLKSRWYSFLITKTILDTWQSRLVSHNW